jgi:hypothetical protein
LPFQVTTRPRRGIPDTLRLRMDCEDVTLSIGARSIEFTAMDHAERWPA